MIKRARYTAKKRTVTKITMKGEFSVMKELSKHIRNHYRVILLYLADLMLVLASYTACFFVCRFDYYYDAKLYFSLLAIILPVYLVVFTAFGLYRSLWRYAQYREFLSCTVAAVLSGVAVFGIARLFSILNWVERIHLYFFVFVACFIAIALVSTRLAFRAFRDYLISKETDQKKRVMIIGCGNACTMLLNEINNTENCPLVPIVGIDEDESKIGYYIGKLKICGTNKDIQRLAKKYRIDLIIVAIPTADNKTRATILDYCAETGCEVKMLPRLYDFREDEVDCIQKLRDITPEELLGREPINIDNDSISGYISGRTVMITGGGGSIGSEICRQIAAFGPRKLIIVDIYENNAYDIQQELIRTYGDKLDLEVHIASVRDRSHLFALMRNLKPQLVIHAAAHKHVPLMEVSPTEAVKNNIIGTLNTAEAAIAAEAERFIMISTDKAVNPTNVMGASKRVCELIVESLNGRSKTEFCAVRFGNVLGSNGSVIPLFKKQIEMGGPVTVTHPEITRFFMTIPEAVQLVLAAGSMANGGEIFVLNMGEPVKISDLAKKLIRLSGYEVDYDIKIEYTGLRPGEKLYEELLTAEEGLSATEHDKIFVSRPTLLDRDFLFTSVRELERTACDETISPDVRAKKIEEKIKSIVPQFVRPEDAPIKKPSYVK
ncbi:MAG: polysaccharide biosynthesis protein [Clostridia bacterium]|nr:polysaccharide biosynthesis protein [Clostridia bacterium]